MVKAKEKHTEQKILIAAKKVFFEKGKDGARMQEIADEAGINKSLLHYYFRSKDKLFDAIFQQAFSKFVPDVRLILEGDETFEKQVYLIVEKYFQLISENPYLPLFILNAISRTPEYMQFSPVKGLADISLANKVLKKAKAEGYEFKGDPRHYIVNLIGLSVIPFLAKNAFLKVLFANDDAAYQQFLNERTNVVANTLLKQLKNEE